MEKIDPKTVADLFNTLESFELFPGDSTAWTVEYMDESDPGGPVVFKDASGRPKMWMPKDVYDRFMAHKAPTLSALSAPVEEVTLAFYPSIDKEITCMVCGRFECDLEAQTYQTTMTGMHTRSVIGKHSKCKLKPVPHA